MNDNEKQQIPIDYLNQIAPKNTSKIDFLRKKSVVIGIIITAILIAITAIVVIVSSFNTQSTQQLAARLLTTNELAEDASSNIKSSQLRALNGNLKIYLTNTIRDIEPILDTEDVKIKNIDKNITAAEASQTIIDTLEDARLNAIYDRTYAREMSYKLDTILTLINQLNKKTNNKDLGNFLDDAYSNLVPIQKELADFNETNI